MVTFIIILFVISTFPKRTSGTSQNQFTKIKKLNWVRKYVGMEYNRNSKMKAEPRLVDTFLKVIPEHLLQEGHKSIYNNSHNQHEARMNRYK